MFSSNSQLHSVHFRVHFVDSHVWHHLLNCKPRPYLPFPRPPHFVLIHTLRLQWVHDVCKLHTLSTLLLVALKQSEDLIVNSPWSLHLRFQIRHFSSHHARGSLLHNRCRVRCVHTTLKMMENEEWYGGSLLVIQIAADAAQKVIRDLVHVEDGLHVVNTKSQLAVENAKLANDFHISVISMINNQENTNKASTLPFE